MNAPAIGSKLLKSASMALPKITPIKAVGMVPMMIRGISFPFSVLKFLFPSALRMFFMSLWKNRSVTMSVPMCNRTSKRMGVSKPKKCSVILRCPVLDMGSHSVMPWIMLRIIVCRGFMWVSPFLVERFVEVVNLGAGVCGF